MRLLLTVNGFRNNPEFFAGLQAERHLLGDRLCIVSKQAFSLRPTVFRFIDPNVFGLFWKRQLS